MSILRVFLAAVFGALAGGGSAMAMIQSGQLDSSTESVAISAGVAAAVAALFTALARFRIIKAVLVLGAIGLTVATFLLAQTPEADAQEHNQDECASARIGNNTFNGSPNRGELGSESQPLRIAISTERDVQVQIRTERRYTDVTVTASIIEPARLNQEIELGDEHVSFQGNQAEATLEIVETRFGFGARFGDTTVPLPFGTVRVESVFTGSDLSPCPLVVHVQLVTSALDTLAGRLALGSLVVGALGLVAVALSAGRAAGAAAATAPPPAAQRPAQARPPATQSPAPPPAPAPAPPMASPATQSPAPPAPAPAPSPPMASPAPPPPAPAPSPPMASPAPPPAPAPAASPPMASPAPSLPAAVTPPVGIPGAVGDPTAPERFVQMRIEADDFPEQGFVAGATNTLSFWIGPEVLDDFVHQASHAVAEVGRTLTLDAQFVWPEGEATSTITLPADRSARSTPKFDVQVDLAATATRFIGTLHLWVRETNRLYEQVKVVGTVGPAGNTDRPHLISIVEDREQIERLSTASTAVGASVVHQGNQLYWYSNAEPEIRDASNVMAVEASLSAAVANMQARAGQIDWTDSAALTLLRTIAVEGAKLRYAVAGDIDPGPALQFYNQQDKTTVPFEWVYDRGFTAEDAVVQPQCIESLRQGLPANHSPLDPFPCGCPAASTLPADVAFSNPILCPWGFWGLAKVIERYDTDPTIVNNVPHPDEDQSLPAFSSVLLAANHTLDQPSGRPGEQAIDLTNQLGFNVATHRVHTWQDFQSHLADNDASLAVTLPHQEADTLQIGTDALHLGQVPALFSEGHSRVILLLGCKTTQPASEGFASFGRLFKDHAAVVIGSSAILVTSDAARLAIGLVRELSKVSTSGEALGTAVVSARRELFAQGYPIALAVTALGDADWRFGVNVPVPAVTV